MIKNQKGDALTLAMGAAVFVGISIMVVIAILGNMDGQVKRKRIINDVESTILYLNQILSTRDICTYALRQESGLAILYSGIAAPSPPVVPKTRMNIPRVYLSDPVAHTASPTSPPIFCQGLPDANGDGIAEQNPACPVQPSMVIRSIQFAYYNDQNNHKPIFYKNTSTQYWLLTGELEVDFDFPEKMVLGGELKMRKFPFSVLYDRTGPVPGLVEMCYTKESPALICAQLGGSLNPVSGLCENMFGRCDVEPHIPPTCGGFDQNLCISASGFGWTTVYYAATVLPGMQMACNCMTVCNYTGP